MTNFASLADFAAWLEHAPSTTALQASSVLEAIKPFAEARSSASASPARSDAHPSSSWRERLWIVPADTRLGVVEVAEALGRPKSFVYRHTGKNAGTARLPHRRLDGELVFVAGELRAWIAANEETIAETRCT